MWKITRLTAGSGVAGSWGIDVNFYLFAGLELVELALMATTIYCSPR